MPRAVIDTLNEFARENTFLSLIILAIIGNIATDIFKKISFFFIINIAKQTSKWSEKNIRFLIRHYEEERQRVERIKHKDTNELFELLEGLYNSVIVSFVIIVIYLIIKVNSDLLFYSVLGAGSVTMFKVIGNTIYNYGLISNSKRFESYNNKIQNKILRLRKLLQEQTPLVV